MTRRRKRVMVVAAAALIVVVLLGWWAIRVEGAVTLRPAHSGMSQLLARLAPSRPDRSGPQGPGAESTQASATERDSVELCGLGRFARKDLEEGGAGHAALSSLNEDAVRRTVERLRAQPDERSRAVAYLLQWSTEWLTAANAATERITRDGIDCSRERCDTPAEPATPSDALDALARLAAGTGDPWVYALAHHLCAHKLAAAEAPACQLISVGRWAQLEPDNAVPWLFAASEAQQRKDAPGVAEALYRASQASRSDVRFGQSAVVAQAQVPADIAPVFGLGIDVSLIGVEAAFALPGYQVVTQHCAKEALSDPNRRAVCEDLATLLVERGSTLLDLSIGLGMGKRLDWPAERIAAIEELRDAIYGTKLEIAALESSASSPLGCPAVEAQREQLREVASQGEVAAYRRIADASPLGRSGLAAQHREAMMQMQRQYKAEEATKEAASAPVN